MAVVGPRKKIRSVYEQREIEKLSKDLRSLKEHRGMLLSLFARMLSSYESVLHRVKTSGDRDLAEKTADHLRVLGGIYRSLSAMRMFSPKDEEFMGQYVGALQEASLNLQVGKQKVSGLVKKAEEQCKILTAMRNKMASMGELKLDPSSLFDNPDKRVANRRQRDIERKLRK